jgi:predicted CXXCH cytochrome family protein
VRALPAVVLGVMLSSACTDETISFRDPFNDPVDQVTGFLGYFAVDDKQTTCGNCHADEQVDWLETAHADAWAGLQSSDHANDTTCGPCHSVSQNGNAVSVPSGYETTFDATYHDVQCESCHGPGIDHVLEPEVVQPLASFWASSDSTNGCGECHSGSHHPFVEQWEVSAHNVGSGFGRGTRSSCDECHNGKVALVEQFGVEADFLEKDDGEVGTITCVVCHDPHAENNPGQLRAPVAEATARNLCIKCHNRRPTPSQTTHGFHAAQGPLVLGENIGWLPDSLEWPQFGAEHFHGNLEANPRMCASCHVEMFTADDGFQSVGHLFEAAPCVDDDGVPVVGHDCDFEDRRWNACAQCHGTPENSLFKFETYLDELVGYLEAIWTDVNGNDTLDVNGPDTGLLVDIVNQGDWTVLAQNDDYFTVAEGVLFNAQLAHGHHAAPWFEEAYYPIGEDDAGAPVYREFGSHPASGAGMHNPTLLRALLVASMSAAVNQYNLAPPAGVSMQLPEDAPFIRK